MNMELSKIDNLYDTYIHNPELLIAHPDKTVTPGFIKDLSSFRDLNNLDENKTKKMLELIDTYIEVNKHQKHAFKNFKAGGFNHNLLSFFMLQYTTDDAIKDHLFTQHNMKLSTLSNNQRLQFLTYFIGGNLHSLTKVASTIGGNETRYPEEILVRHKRYNLEHIDDLKKYEIGDIKPHSKLTSAYAGCLMEAYFLNSKNMSDERFLKLFTIANIALNDIYTGKAGFYSRKDKAMPYFSLELLNDILLHSFKTDFLKDKKLSDVHQGYDTFYLNLRRFLDPSDVKKHCSFFIEEVKPLFKNKSDDEKLKLFYFYNTTLYNERKNDNFYDDYHFMFINTLDKENLSLYKKSIDMVSEKSKYSTSYSDLYDNIYKLIYLRDEKFTLLNNIEETSPEYNIKKRL